MSLKIFLYLFFSFSFLYSHSQNSTSLQESLSQWRGPNRNGIYPDKNLLKKWPENGPELLWSFEGLGSGHGNASFSKNKMFILGMPDSTGILYAFDLRGKLLWKKSYGPEWNTSYGGPRVTPTIAGDLVYFESGKGVVYCYNGETGEKIWQVDLLKNFNAKNVEWGKAECLLIDGDRLICTPGGIDNNIAALDRFSGKTIWTVPGNHQPAAYNSPILVEHNGTRLIVTLTSESIIGLDAETGRLYWQEPLTMEYKNNANTPVYYNGFIYATGAEEKPTSGMLCLKLSQDGKSVKVQWRNQEFTNLMGGFIVNDGNIFLSKFSKKTWYCIDSNTGSVKSELKKLTDGAAIYADGLFYCYGEDGLLSLVDANPTTVKVISSFKIKSGTDQHWAHPVIHMGCLYVRHGNTLMVYNIK